MLHLLSKLPLVRHIVHQPRWWALGFIGLCLGHAVVTPLTLSFLWMLVVTLCWLAMAWLFRWGNPRHPRPPKRIWPWSLIPLIMWWFYVYMADTYGDVDIAAIFFHLQAGMEGHGGGKRFLTAITYTLAAFISLVAFVWLVRHDHRWRLWERILVLFLLATNPLLFGITQRSSTMVTEDGAWLDRRYIEPNIVQTPDDPPNLLYIYLESIERTYDDKERFGDAYDDFNAIGEDALVFEGVRQLDNTGWTMAGMIASQCGAPLMPAGLLHDKQFEPLDHVVPGVDCLGDLLDKRGYQLTYMGGASKDFAGKGLFYNDHGFDNVLGRDELEPRLEDPDYVNSWGLYDDSLYNMLVEEIRDLDSGDAPWGVVALTLGAHPPFGFPADSCKERQGEFDGEDILYSVECTGWLTRRLLDRLEQAGLLDNTLVVIASDHLSMKVSAWDKLVGSDRENTLMFLGNGVEPARMRRESTTLDILPTILALMGYATESHRAGLGVSLLADPQNLVERHGIGYLNERLTEESALQERLWEGVDRTSPTH
ncbi:sulfatase-like hydrolase/transferase [Aidingimonas lacisalsi]|uniref:sulfatase-like hydrolase/transferase n=1 Tax=Aidingimonas lacisalsi TaxID=2604086 RepID=UPI002ED06A5A